jgi:hypothetical protein
LTDASRAHAIEPEIDRFIAEGQYSLAVILSQTLLELLVEREAKALAERLDTGAFGAAALELLGGFNLNRRTQRFFEHALDLRFDQEMPGGDARLPPPQPPAQPDRPRGRRGESGGGRSLACGGRRRDLAAARDRRAGHRPGGLTDPLLKAAARRGQ